MIYIAKNFVLVDMKAWQGAVNSIKLNFFLQISIIFGYDIELDFSKIPVPYWCFLISLQSLKESWKN